MVQTFDTAAFKAAMEKKQTLVVDFWASWCMPCRMLSPTIEELGQEVSDVKIAKINVDEEEQLARMFRVNSIPTLVMVKDGKVVSRSVGVQTKDRILAMIDENK